MFLRCSNPSFFAHKACAEERLLTYNQPVHEKFGLCQSLKVPVGGEATHLERKR